MGPSLTRRRALLLGAAAGLGSMVPAAWARQPRAFSKRVGRDEFGSVVRAPRRFDLVGVRGERVPGLELRVRARGGSWSTWVPVGHGDDHRPDTGTGQHASDPVWAGDAHELQLRAPRPPRGPLTLEFVAVPPAAKRAGARASARARTRAGAAQAGGPPPIITREQWGAAAYPPRAEPSYGEVQAAFIHHTVSANEYAPEDSPAIVLGILKYHRNTNGWNDIGYNFLVDKYGQLFEGRAGGVDQAVIGAQAQGWNSYSTGISNIGTYSDVPQTEPALDAIARLIAWKLPLHGVPVEGTVVLTSGGGDSNRHPYGQQVTYQRINGHRDANSTACPGNALFAQLPELRRRAAGLAPAVAAAVRVSLDRVETAAVPYGDKLELSGVVKRGDGSAVASQRVAIQKRGASGWVSIGEATTNGAGAWRGSIVWKRAGQVRARVALGGSKVAVSPAIAVGLVPVLEAEVQTRRVRAGRSATVQGIVRPVAPVRVVIEREGKGGRYAYAGEITIRPQASRFKARVALRKPGLYRLTPRVKVGTEAVASSALYVRAVRRGKSLGTESGGAPAG